MTRYFDDYEDGLPFYKHMTLLLLAVVFVAGIGWARWATLDEVTRGDGKVIPSTDLQAVQSLEAGIVEEFLVREGDRVRAGQIVMRLSDIEASSDLGANRARYMGLMASIQRLQAEAEGASKVTFQGNVRREAADSVAEEMNVFRANRRQIQGQVDILRQQLTQKEQEVAETNSRIRDLRAVLALLKSERDVIVPLVKRGAAPQIELLQLQRNIKEKESELNSVQAGLPRSRSAIREARARLKDVWASAKAQAQEALSVKLLEKKEIQQRLSALTERKTRTELRSPVSGTVQEVTVSSVGSVTRPGEDLILIVPEDDQLIVEARIRPADRAFIYPGQKAVIKITAYDFSIYGGLEGEVLEISADSIADDQGESFYRVRLKTDDSVLNRNGQALPIIPGMVAQVDILTGKKTVLAYLMKPLIKTLDNAMNER